MKYRMSKMTLCLACLVVASYAMSWTGVAVGLGVLGMLFETLGFLSSMRDDRLREAHDSTHGVGRDAEVR
jgi:uncharacterized membrane protein YkgB